MIFLRSVSVEKTKESENICSYGIKQQDQKQNSRKKEQTKNRIELINTYQRRAQFNSLIQSNKKESGISICKVVQIAIRFRIL